MLFAPVFSSVVYCVRFPLPSTGAEGGTVGGGAQGASQRYAFDAVFPRLCVILRVCQVLLFDVEACFLDVLAPATALDTWYMILRMLISPECFDLCV